MTANVNVGVILEINGEDVSLEPKKSIGNVKETGVDYFLPRRVEVGTANNLQAFLNTLADGIPPLPTGADFPSPLKDVYEKVTSLNLAVEQLDIHVPPSEKDGQPITTAQPTTLTVGLSATWSDATKINLISGKLAIKGLYVKLAIT